jgi:hypothetical protein
MARLAVMSVSYSAPHACNSGSNDALDFYCIQQSLSHSCVCHNVSFCCAFFVPHHAGSCLVTYGTDCRRSKF